jgi:hypothetical protein
MRRRQEFSGTCDGPTGYTPMKDRSKKRHPGVFSALPFFGENKVLNRPSWPAPKNRKSFMGVYPAGPPPMPLHGVTV